MKALETRLSVSYHYDPLDRLISLSTEQTPTMLYYRDNRLATQIHGQNYQRMFQTEFFLLAQQSLTDKNTNSLLLVADERRSVLATQRLQELSVTAFTAYGLNPVSNSLLGFNGEYPQPLTLHYLLGNGYRAYNPVLMRFNSPDSWSPFGAGKINAYAYAEGDPVNHTDPTGHSIVSSLLKLLGRADNVDLSLPKSYSESFTRNQAKRYLKGEISTETMRSHLLNSIGVNTNDLDNAKNKFFKKAAHVLVTGERPPDWSKRVKEANRLNAKMNAAIVHAQQLLVNLPPAATYIRKGSLD